MDQVVYLFEAYRAALTGQASGLLAGLMRLIGDAPPAGVGLQATAYGVMMVNGISRMSALAVNFAYFVAVPGLLSLIIGRERPAGVHLFLWGFWLCVQSMYALIGGPLDFRLDFAGMALFALACALIWRTDVFTRPLPCILTGLVIGWLCLTRFIVAIHIVMMGLLLLGSILIFPSLPSPRSTWKGVALTVVVAAAGVLPYVALQWRSLWDYYVVGHVTGPEEQIRSVVQGFSGWRGALAFYPRALINDQLGPVASKLLVATLALALAAVALKLLRQAWLGRRSLVVVPLSRPAIWAVVVVMLAGLAPFITLNADVLKSNVVANVFVVWAGGLGVLAFLLIDNTLRSMIGIRWARWATLGLGGLAFAVGITHELEALARPTFITEHRADFAARDQMLTLITETSIANKWQAPLLFVDYVSELDGLQMELSHFERYGTDLQIGRLLAQIAEVPPDELWRSLLKADFLIIRDPSAKLVGTYPFDVQMARLNPKLQEFCAARCQKLGSFTYFNTPLTLYSRDAGPIPEDWKPHAMAREVQQTGIASLSLDPFEAEGVYPDGWIEGRASFIFHLNGQNRNALSVTGQLPSSPPNGVAKELVRLSINGMMVAEQKVNAGDFMLRVNLAPIKGDIRLTIEGNASFPLAPPDTRTVSLRIRSVQWDSGDKQ
jgi:hypothetical protein